MRRLRDGETEYVFGGRIIDLRAIRDIYALLAVHGAVEIRLNDEYAFDDLEEFIAFCVERKPAVHKQLTLSGGDEIDVWLWPQFLGVHRRRESDLRSVGTAHLVSRRLRQCEPQRGAKGVGPLINRMIALSGTVVGFLILAVAGWAVSQSMLRVAVLAGVWGLYLLVATAPYWYFASYDRAVVSFVLWEEPPPRRRVRELLSHPWFVHPWVVTVVGGLLFVLIDRSL